MQAELTIERTVKVTYKVVAEGPSEGHIENTVDKADAMQFDNMDDYIQHLRFNGVIATFVPLTQFVSAESKVSCTKVDAMEVV